MAGAPVDRLEEYIEQLYSDNPADKIQVAKQILCLLQDAEHLEQVVNHESLLGILARTLRDEYRKSIDLSIFLSGIFCVLSSYADLHPVLLQNQIGDTTMKIIDYHIQKFALFKADLDSQGSGQEYARELKKFEILDKKQNRLLTLCLAALMNLAEDVKIERKMKRRGIIKQLVSLLPRDNLKLLETLFKFLKKLSIFAENKNELVDQECVAESLQRFLPCPQHEALCQTVLGLLHNLSFDENFRQQMGTYNFIPRLVSLLKENAFRGVTLRILYQLSLEDKCKSTFTYTECIPIMFMLIIKFPGAKVGKELVAFAINLCTNARNAEIFADGKQLEALIKRALQHKDDLVLKLVRNIARSAKTEAVQRNLTAFAKEFIQVICSDDEAEFVVELLGILVQLEVEAAWPKLLASTPLLDYLQRNLVVGYAEDDIVLECIMLVGTFTSSEKSAKLLADTLVIKLMHALLSEKQEDDEMVMQIMYGFHKMLHFRHSRSILLDQTETVSYLLELMQDKNPRIKSLADSILSVVQEYDLEWKEEIKAKRFSLYNSEWVTTVQQSELGEWDENSEQDSEHMHWADLSDLGNNVWGEVSEDE